MDRLNSSLRRPSILPGFGFAFGTTLIYLGLIVLLPLAALSLRASGLGFSGLWAIATEPRVVAALKVSFGLALAAAAINAVFGTIVAWVLVRYAFPGRRLLDAAVDLPFALPTAVAGIALASIYAPNGWVGSLVEPLGWKAMWKKPPRRSAPRACEPCGKSFCRC
jgi:sulfate transport system permease protein